MKLTEDRKFLIASPEKALIEELIVEKAISDPQDIGMWMESHRIDEGFLHSLCVAKISKLYPHFHSRQVRYLIEWLKKEL